ncbi:hypothetical protein ABI59_05970 [Acidobacteria bacterium Mor1]|nr:hypothetical protein ABI59_05970 [Acidobacteria bacterium Mor1]
MSDLERWQRWHDDLWTYSIDFTMMRAHIGRRMTAVRGADGWTLVGPVPLSDGAGRELTTEAPVRRLVVQTAFHNTFVPEAHRDWPDAEIYLTEGAKKEGLAREQIRPLSGWPAEHGELEPIPLEGMPRVNEVALYHRDSRSLILADWMMHFPEGGSTFGTNLFLKLFRWVPGTRVSPLYRMMIKDKPAFRGAAEKISALEVERVLPGHGEPLTGGIGEALASLEQQSVG